MQHKNSDVEPTELADQALKLLLELAHIIDEMPSSPCRDGLRSLHDAALSSAEKLEFGRLMVKSSQWRRQRLGRSR